ncbi:MAG: lasso peptide biosynthesis B2 protein [Actinomycetota bacterium]
MRYLVELSVLLVIVRVRLSRRGFQPTVAWSTTLNPARHCHEAGVHRTIELAMTDAQRVFRWHPVANKCLEQSLVLCKFLARRGIRAELIVAVRKYPFGSHAWARWGEVLLTDPPAQDPEHFHVIARF